jgi:hypothetical protein
MKNIKHVLILSSILCSSLLYGCSGSGGGSSNSNDTPEDNGDINNLQVIVPKTIYSFANKNSVGYVVLNNSGSGRLKNVHYSLTSLIGGAKNATINEASAELCKTLPAYSQCNIKIEIPAGAVAGSITVSAYNSTTLSNKLTKQSTTKIANQMNTMGVEQAAYNDITGADGITLSYYTTAINGVSYIIVSGLVASANAGIFNKITLVDSNNNPIANQQFIGNNSNFDQGDTFFIMIPVPHGIGLTQTIKAQTQYVASDGKVKIISTATTSNTLTTTENVGIIEPLPSSIYLTELNPEQIITFANTGDTLVRQFIKFIKLM